MAFSKPLPANKEGTQLTVDHFESAVSLLAREHRTIFLQSMITGWPGNPNYDGRTDVFSPTQLFIDILAMNKEDSKTPITMVINSEGGSVDAGMMLYDAIRSSKAPIHTVGINCASMATVLLGAGVKRYAFPHGRFMLHLLSAGFKGTMQQIEIQTRELTRIHNMLTDCYIECGITAGLKSKNPSEATIRKKLLKDMEKGDFWLSADEAVKYGLVDGILDPKDLF